MAVDDESGYEECMSIARWTSKTVGLWPPDEGVILPLCKVLMLLILLVFCLIIPQMRKIIKVHGDFNLVLQVLTTAFINYCIALVKILTMCYYKRDLKKLLAEVKKDWQNISTEEQRIMRSYSKLCRRILTVVVSCTLSSAVGYPIVFAITFKSNIIYENGTAIRPLWVLTDFPFDTRHSPIYEVVICCQCVAVIFTVISFTAYDCIYVSSVLHLSGQLHNLQQRFRELVREHQQTRLPFARCLEYVIKRHLHIVSCAGIIEDTYNKEFLVRVFGTSVALCLQGYQFVMLISETNAAAAATLIFIIVFTLTNLGSIFMYCFNAQILRNESEALFFAVYQAQWYEMPPKDADLVVFIMTRCIRPIEITAGKITPLTLEYFTKVMKTSAGYLSVLLAVKDKFVE